MSRITSDGHLRRIKLLSHGRVAKSFPGGTVGIGGPRRAQEQPGRLPKSTARKFNARDVSKLCFS